MIHHPSHLDIISMRSIMHFFIFRIHFMTQDIEEMAQNNLTVIKRTKLTEFIDTNSPKRSLFCGDQFMKKYLDKEQFTLFCESANLDDNFEINKEKEVVQEILSNDVCMILIRPEMTHFIEEIKGFMSQKGFTSVFEVSQKLTKEQYWDIYHRGITHPGARHTMPTRTLVYTSSNVTTMVFRSLKKRTSSSADTLFYELKGEAGSYSANTLRGDLIFHEAKKIGLDNIDMDRTTALAVDPFASYRHIVKQNVTSSARSDELLKYTSVSVHIPNSKEIGRDLSVLLDKDQLTSILNYL